MPFFKILHNASKFNWGEEQSKAFKSLKDYLTSVTKMTAPNPKDTLLLYVAASHSIVSAALVLEREVEGHQKQVSIYFISKALSGSKLFYSKLEKIAYAVIMSSIKLHHYFEDHRILIVTSQPLHDLFSNRETSTRISKWAAELTSREQPSSPKS